jgi:hypothetical protein
MLSIEEELETRLEKFPILLDKDFRKQYPKINKIVRFLYESAKTNYELYGEFDIFDGLGIRTIEEYIKLIVEKDPRALESYQKLRETLRG